MLIARAKAFRKPRSRSSTSRNLVADGGALAGAGAGAVVDGVVVADKAEDKDEEDPRRFSCRVTPLSLDSHPPSLQRLACRGLACRGLACRGVRPPL